MPEMYLISVNVMTRTRLKRCHDTNLTVSNYFGSTQTDARLLWKYQITLTVIDIRVGIYNNLGRSQTRFWVSLEVLVIFSPSKLIPGVQMMSVNDGFTPPYPHLCLDCCLSTSVFPGQRCCENCTKVQSVHVALIMST